MALPVLIAAFLGALVAGLVQSGGLFTLGAIGKRNENGKEGRVMPWALAASLYNLLTGKYVYDFPRTIERSVAMLVHEGRTNQQIAHMLNISVKTVEAYLTRLYRKTSCSSRVELAVAIYLDAINIFLALLRLFSSRRG